MDPTDRSQDHQITKSRDYPYMLKLGGAQVKLRVSAGDVAPGKLTVSMGSWLSIR